MGKTAEPEKKRMTAEEFHEYADDFGPIETVFEPGVFAVLFDDPEHWRLEWIDGKAYYRKLERGAG